MIQAGESIGGYLPRGSVVFLQGDLGSGKTTLVKGILRGLGFDGLITSPTYTLVEVYQLTGGPVYHFDLYRLDEPEELEAIGFRDALVQDSIALIEWPQRGRGHLPVPDFVLALEFSGDGRVLFAPEELLGAQCSGSGSGKN